MVRLTEAITKYTNLDLTTPMEILFLHVQFISQSAPNIWEKLQKLEQGPQTSHQYLLNTAFRVFNNRDGEAKWKKEKHLKVKYQLLASALNPRPLEHIRLPAQVHPTEPLWQPQVHASTVTI
jgi:hypothetical protein